MWENCETSCSNKACTLACYCVSSAETGPWLHLEWKVSSQTIIEALKYVTTGIAPPGTGKGREFVHDPCLTEKRDVLAQIRLLCKRSGMPLTVTRQMQLKHSEKTGKHSFKTLDVAVRFRRFNPSSGAVDEHGISYKTSEADTHVCKLMGAP